MGCTDGAPVDPPREPSRFERLQARVDELEETAERLAKALEQALIKINEHERYIATGHVYKWCSKCRNYALTFNRVWMDHPAMPDGTGKCENSLKSWVTA